MRGTSRSRSQPKGGVNKVWILTLRSLRILTPWLPSLSINHLHVPVHFRDSISESLYHDRQVRGLSSGWIMNLMISIRLLIPFRSVHWSCGFRRTTILRKGDRQNIIHVVYHGNSTVIGAYRHCHEAHSWKSGFSEKERDKYSSTMIVFLVSSTRLRCDTVGVRSGDVCVDVTMESLDWNVIELCYSLSMMIDLPHWRDTHRHSLFFSDSCCTWRCVSTRWFVWC